MDDEIKDALKAMASSYRDELINKEEAELEGYWFFEWDNNKTSEENLYVFFKCLKLYEKFCRRWEEEHNGVICVVERVRDKYLMPKIREFLLYWNTDKTKSNYG